MKAPAKLARSAGVSPAQVRPSKPPGSECCVRRRRRRTRSVHSGCVPSTMRTGFSRGRRDEFIEKSAIITGKYWLRVSEVSRNRPVIVPVVDRTSWPGHRGESWATPEETGSRPERAGKDQIITHPIGHETGWTTARSLGEVRTTSVHSKPICLCSDCTFLDEIHRAAL